MSEKLIYSAKISNPLLSICIPTYNREMFLPALLDSIIMGISEIEGSDEDPKIEVVISDNASTDGTAKCVEMYRDRLSITYVIHDKNVGPDLNFLAVIDAARGRFCWLMGSDDIVEAGGLKHVYNASKVWDVSGFSTNYHKRSFDLEHASTVRQPVPYIDAIVVEGRDDIYRNFVGHWGYMSCQVVRRDLWQEVCKTGKQHNFLNGYVHIFIIGKMLEIFPKWGYINNICVAWRGRNDAFLNGDHVDRMMIDVKGYGDITRHLFGENSPTTHFVMNNIAGTHILSHYQVAKVFYHSGKSLRRAAVTISREYWRYPLFWKKLVPWIVMPAPLLHGLWIGYQRSRYRFNPSFKIHPQARKRP